MREGLNGRACELGAPRIGLPTLWLPLAPWSSINYCWSCFRHCGPSGSSQAARTLLGQLRSWVSNHGLSRYWRWVRPANRAVLLEDAIQHVAVVASTGKTRFRGTTPAEAVVWCRRCSIITS